MGGVATFKDNGKGKILDKDCVSKTYPSIENIYFVEGLKHNLLSISQLCDASKRMLFESSTCLIKDADTNKVLFVEIKEIMCMSSLPMILMIQRVLAYLLLMIK